MFLSPSLWYEVADGRPLLSLICAAREALISVLTLLHVRATAPPLSPPSRPAQERETKEDNEKDDPYLTSGALLLHILRRRIVPLVPSVWGARFEFDRRRSYRGLFRFSLDLSLQSR